MRDRLRHRADLGGPRGRGSDHAGHLLSPDRRPQWRLGRQSPHRLVCDQQLQHRCQQHLQHSNGCSRHGFLRRPLGDHPGRTCRAAGGQQLRHRAEGTEDRRRHRRWDGGLRSRGDERQDRQYLRDLDLGLHDRLQLQPDRCHHQERDLGRQDHADRIVRLGRRHWPARPGLFAADPACWKRCQFHRGSVVILSGGPRGCRRLQRQAADRCVQGQRFRVSD